MIVYLTVTLSLFNIDTFLKSQVYGHDFVPNESASFLSFTNQLQAESELVRNNLANGNSTLAKEHATRAIELLNSKDPVNNVAWRDEIAERNQRVADELVIAVSNLENMTELSSSSSLPEQQQSINQSIGEIDAIIDEAVTTRIDRDQRTNATIQATALGDIINTLLRYYGDAYEVGFDMGNMSEMASMMGNSSNTNYTLANVAEYQSAQALAAIAQEIFNNELRPLANSNATNSIANLEDGLIQLRKLIENKSSPTELVMVGHSQVHPSLQSAFNLRLQMQM
jgi:hypothetical protein